MPTPSTSLATLRPDLAASLEQFDLAMDRQGFIASRVLPVMDVQVQSGTFGKIPLASLLQNQETARNSRGGYNRGNWEFTTDSFTTKENGWEEAIDDREAKLYAGYFDAALVSTARAFDFVLRAAERRVCTLLQNTTTWTGASLTTAVSTAWTMANRTTSTPLVDVEAAVRKVWSGTGLWPNALIIGKHTFRNLQHTSQVIDKITSSGAGNPAKPTDITAEMMSRVFDLPKIIVAGSAKNTANEGQTVSIAPVWSNDYAIVARIADTADIREPCLGRTFHWSADGSQIGGTVETYRDETVRSDMVRVRHETHEKVLYTELAHLLTNTNGGSVA